MLSKENIEEQVTDNQSRLIRMQKEDALLSSSQKILKLPEGFTVEKAIGGGDCFFDAVAQGLRQLKPGEGLTVKSLREVCRNQALSSQEMKEKIIADARNRGDSTVVIPEPGIDDGELWKTYLIGIEYSNEYIEEMQRNNKDVFSSLTDLKYGSTLQVPICGRPEIEGRMICNEYNVKLHVIEDLPMFGWSGYLIDGSVSKFVSTDYNEKDTIHIINKGDFHFEPILSETLLISEIQREFTCILEDYDLTEDGKLEKLKSFFKVYPSLNVNSQMNQYGDTPLHIAVCMGELKIVRFLLKIGAQVDVLNGERKTPIDIAKDNNRKDIAKILQPLISYEEVDVPGDGNCLFWSVALAYLTPVKFDNYSFHKRFKELFASDRDVHSIQRLMQSNANIYEDSTMRQLVTKTFREEVIDQVCFSKREFENKVSIEDLFESQSGSYFTVGTFKGEFEREFSAKKIKQCNIDISKLQPNVFDKNSEKEICTELNKIKNRNEVQEFIFDTYLKCMEMTEIWGGKHEINATSEMLETTIIVSQKDSKDYIYNEKKKYCNKIHLSYKKGNHYQFYQIEYSNLMKFILNFIQSFETRLTIYDVLASTLREGNRVFSDGMDTSRFVRSIFGCSTHIDNWKMSSVKATLRTGNIIKATKSFINLSDLIETFNEYKSGFRKILVDAGCNIFQSFEMQFEKMGFDHVSKIADDIVDKIIEYYIQKEHKGDLQSIGIAETLVISTHLQEVSAQYGDVSYNLKDLYENIGIAEGSEGSFIYYRKKSEDKSSQYGYRRSLMGEKSKRTYDTKHIRVENTNVELENYVYTLDALVLQDFKNTVDQVFYIVNEEIQMPNKKVIKDLIVKIKSHIEEEVSFLGKHILFCYQERKQNLDMNVKYLVKEEGKKEQDIIGGKELIERTEKNSDVISLMEKNLKTIQNSSYYLKVKEVFVKHSETVSQNYSNPLESEHGNTARPISLWSTVKKSLNVKRLSSLLDKINFKDVCPPVEEFTGRQEQIEEIYTKLQGGAVVIVGPSGIGKTQLARKFVEENKGVYLHTYEVDTQDILSIESSFGSLVRDRLAMSMEQEKCKGRKKYLFLFQGAKKEDLERILKIRGQRGGFDCLFTSSDQDYQDIAEVSLDNLGEKEAIQLVKRILEIVEISQDEQIKALIRKLKGFPLAINLAAACIRNEGSSPLRKTFRVFEYLMQYRKFDQKFPRNTSQSEYDRILQITLLLSIKTIEGMCSGEKVLKILNAMAYFDSDEIDSDLFLSWVKDKDELNSIFKLLERCHMIDVKERDVDKMYLMHESVKKALRSWLSATDVEGQVLKFAIELMIDQSIDFGHENVGHFMSVFYYSKEHKNLTEENVIFSLTILNILNNLCKYKEVIEFGSEVLNLPTIIIEDIMMVRYEVACAQIGLGNYDVGLAILLDLKKQDNLNNIFPYLSLDEQILSAYFQQEYYKDVLPQISSSNKVTGYEAALFYVRSNKITPKMSFDRSNKVIRDEYEKFLNILTDMAGMLVIRRKYSEAQIMLYHIKNLRDEFLLKDESNDYGYFYHYPSEDYEYYNLKAKYINALLYFRMSRDNKKVISEEMLINVECLERKESIKILFDVLEDIKDPEASFFIKYSVDSLKNTDKEDLRLLALKNFKYVLSMIEDVMVTGYNFIALSVEFYIAMLHSDLEEKAQGLQDLQKVQEKIIGLNHPSTLETVNAIQKLFTRDEDRSTYLENEIEKRESLLQFEKSDLNAQGVSILKEMYAKENKNDYPSVNASSSGELLPGNKRKSLGTENIQAKRKKVDNQQQVSSFLDGIDIDSGYQQNDMVSLYR